MAGDDQVFLTKLKCLRQVNEKVYWDTVDNIEPRLERSYIHRLCDLFKNWSGEYPVILDVFEREEIDHLLAHSVYYDGAHDDKGFREIIIRFLIRAGYKDKAVLDKDGKLFVRRVTGVHLTARHKCPGWVNQIRDLFDIYADFNVNYVDELGFTHLHAACMTGCYYVVEKFIEHGQDIDCRTLKTGDTPLHLALEYDRKHIAEVLLSRGACPNLPNAEGLTALHVICKKCDDWAFVKSLLEKYQSIAIDARDKYGNTPLHLVLQFGASGIKNIIETLVRRGANLSLVNNKRSTALHMICERDQTYGFAKTLFDLCDELKQQINLQDQEGNTPLHIALKNGNENLVEFLLRKKANPNLTNKNESTPLHNIRKSRLMEIFFKINKELDQPVQVDTLDKFDKTPLMWALEIGRKDLVKILLSNGANPQLANRARQTPLHIICQRSQDDVELLELFLKLNIQRPVQLGVKDNLGNTPLHEALISGNEKVAEHLLTIGVDCNSANKAGSTPLHIICWSGRDCDSFVSKFFDICKMKNQTVNIDARDEKNRTPLQGAVANLCPKLIDLLMENGASVTNFVFPSKSDLEANFKGGNEVKVPFITKLETLSSVLLVVEQLEKKRYEMGQDEGVTIMELFIKHKAFEQTIGFTESWFEAEQFTANARKIMMNNSSLSLHDLIHLKPKEASKRLTLTDFHEFVRSKKLQSLPKAYQRACLVHLMEKMSRQFFWECALDAVLNLTCCRVPILPCEMMIEDLTNKDLYHICLAGQLK